MMKRFLFYITFVVMGSLSLTALGVVIDLKEEEYWKRVVNDAAHVLWGVVITWASWWTFGTNARTLECERMLREIRTENSRALAILDMMRNETPPEPTRTIEIEL